MQCIKETVSNNYPVFEEEIKDHNRSGLAAQFKVTNIRTSAICFQFVNVFLMVF